MFLNILLTFLTFRMFFIIVKNVYACKINSNLNVISKPICYI